MSNLKLTLMVPLAAAAVSASGIAAQACLGLPSFSGGAIHLNGAGEFPDSASAWAVGIGGGLPASIFGNVGGGQASFEGLDEKSSFGFLELGYQIPVGPAQLCPVAGGTLGTGPDDDEIGLELESRSASAGLAVGLPLSAGSFQIVPNVSVKYEYLSVKVEETGFEPLTETYSSGILDLGLALVINDRFSVQPLFHVPFGGEEGDETSFGVFAAFSFGWKAR